VSEDIRALSATLARDPGSLVYVELAEALRRRGQLGEAAQVVLAGLARHPQHADGYDCLARIHADRGELPQARAAWERALTIAPEHPGALKGIGFVYWRLGDARRAAEALEHALLVEPGDNGTRRALEAVRVQAFGHAAERGEAPGPESPAQLPEPVPDADAPAAAPPESRADAPLRPPLFVGLEGATADILLLDARGLVLAGGLTASDGSDVSELAAAALAGVSGEAGRTAGYLELGAWTTIVAEADGANVVLAPVGEGALLMVRRERSTPVGLALRIAERARGVAARWLEGLGA
jgi:tetratricopeptide (TPR) repeat protein